VISLPNYVFDPERLAALDGYAILDTPAEQGFDDIVQLTMFVCQTPVALVSFVSHDRQWFKARAGFEPCETGLSSSVCAHALVERDLLIIPDLSIDPRSADNPLVNGPPHIRFYAGAPLRTDDGHVIGSLCAIDGIPRPNGLNSSQASSLRNLAKQVMSQLDLRRALTLQREALQREAEAGARRAALLTLGDRLRTGAAFHFGVGAEASLVTLCPFTAYRTSAIELHSTWRRRPA
jgi:GAF domain-containing protein